MDEIKGQLDSIQEMLDAAQTDAIKFAKSNNAAGTRLRVAMQRIKKVAQDVREMVSEQKNA